MTPAERDAVLEEAALRRLMDKVRADGNSKTNSEILREFRECALFESVRASSEGTK